MEQNEGKLPQNQIKSLQGIKKVDALLSQKEINIKDLVKFSDSEISLFFERINEGLARLKDTERDDFLKKIAPFMGSDFNEDIWEYNHIKITNAISRLITEKGRMPSKIELAYETGLSRTTVQKHLKEYKAKDSYLEHEEKYKIMKGDLLSRLYAQGVRGDVKATRLFMEATGLLGNRQKINQHIIENQHNYIQINETRLSQEQIQKLSPEKLKQIEELLKIPESRKTKG